MLEKYKKQRDLLLKQYNQLQSMESLFPIKIIGGGNINKEDIKEKKEQLESEQFFVSITGQIKSGKSTLINALIFEKEIIPADDTPHTAKITILKYAKEPKVEVEFYSQKEWRDIKNSKEFDKYIKADVEEAMQKGVFTNEVIMQNPLKKIAKVEELDDFVAKNGKYTPFVNTVTLYYPIDILKDITIVDTPGTNDPNPVRDRVAREWIKNTNANIYVVYAGQAFADQDIEFIDKFLISVPKKQKITVVNKIDTIEGRVDGVKNWQKELSQNEKIKDKEIFTGEDSVVYVSALGALLDKMDRNKEPFTESMEELFEMLEERGFLEPESYRLDDLKRAIEKKLIENKGSNIIISHQEFIDSIFRIKIFEIEGELLKINSSLKDLTGSLDDIKEKREVVERLREELKKQTDKALKTGEKLKIDSIDKLDKNLTKLFGGVGKKLEAKLNSFDKFTRQSLLNLNWKTKKEFENTKEELKETLVDIEDNIKMKFKSLMDDLKEKMIKVNKNIIDVSFIIREVNVGSSKYLTDDIVRYIDAEFEGGELLGDIYKEYDAFFFNTQSNYNKMREKAIGVIDETLRRIREKITNDLIGNIEEYFEKEFHYMEEEAKPFLKSKERELRILEKDFSKIDSIRQELKEKQKKYKKELEEIKKLQKEIDGNK